VKSDQLRAYLEGQGISVDFIEPKHSFFDPMGEIEGSTVLGLPKAKVTTGRVNISELSAESMSLASMYAVNQLTLTKNCNVLDTCAAPGMKGMYVNALEDVQYYANDLSGDRLARMVRLFEKHAVKPANITKYDARFIERAYDAEYFDRIIVDAPCSGEGVALGGDGKLLEAWSTAKVKRLQQLQIKIVKSAWKLLKPGGRLVYATCTLNQNENERVIKKALGVSLNVEQRPLLPIPQQMLNNGQAILILPSSDSIGFFVAVLCKADTDEYSDT
jgi:16S rRNA (cytosine967-C5)-methyltransferase